MAVRGAATVEEIRPVGSGAAKAASMAVRGAATVEEIPAGDWRQGGQDGEQSGTGQGSFAGRGPEGYRCSDERIMEGVYELLTRDPEVDTGDVEVTVTGGALRHDT